MTTQDTPLAASYYKNKATPARREPKCAAYIDTRSYELSHGRTPRGWGLWLFEIDGELWHPRFSATYGESLKEAKRYACELGASNIKVMP